MAMARMRKPTIRVSAPTPVAPSAPISDSPTRSTSQIRWPAPAEVARREPWPRHSPAKALRQRSARRLLGHNEGAERSAHYDDARDPVASCRDWIEERSSARAATHAPSPGTHTSRTGRRRSHSFTRSAMDSSVCADRSGRSLKIPGARAGRSPATASRRRSSGPEYSAADRRGARVLSARAPVSMSGSVEPCWLSPSPTGMRPRSCRPTNCFRPGRATELTTALATSRSRRPLVPGYASATKGGARRTAAWRSLPPKLSTAAPVNHAGHPGSHSWRAIVPAGPCLVIPMATIQVIAEDRPHVLPCGTAAPARSPAPSLRPRRCRRCRPVNPSSIRSSARRRSPAPRPPRAAGDSARPAA